MEVVLYILSSNTETTDAVEQWEGGVVILDQTAAENLQTAK